MVLCYDKYKKRLCYLGINVWCYCICNYETKEFEFNVSLAYYDENIERIES